MWLFIVWMCVGPHHCTPTKKIAWTEQECRQLEKKFKSDLKDWKTTNKYVYYCQAVQLEEDETP